jgi:hypothetical protein
MTVIMRRPSHKTIITNIRRLVGNEPDLPDDLQKGTAYAIDAVVDGKTEHFYYVEGNLGGALQGCTKIFGFSVGVYRILSPFVQSYVRGKHYDFPVDLGLV